MKSIGRRTFLTWAIAAVATVGVSSCSSIQNRNEQVTAVNAGPGQKTLVFTHVTVIDATGAPAKPDMTVVIKGGRIAALGKTANVDFPENAHVVDATGKFLIPGLWDMHAHLWIGKRYLALFTANGVTGIRIMDGTPYQHEWRKEISAGELIGPRIIIASPPIDGPNQDKKGFFIVSNEEEGRQAVRRSKEEGADFIKLFSYVPRDAYFGIADEARKLGIPFAGHIPYLLSAVEVSNAGQHTIEHVSDIQIDCSSKQEWIRKHQMENRPLYDEGPNLIVDTYSEKKALELFACLVKNNTWVCPTFGRRGMDKSLANDPRIKYLPSSIINNWRAFIDAHNDRTAEFRADYNRYWQKQIELVGVMGRAGVGLLAGTDTPAYYCIPGFGLHDELALFVRAGLSPMQALQTATYNAAKCLGLLDSMGTIEQGKTADLVLLDANPLRNIMNTQKIAAVVVGGKFFDKTKLQNMLAQVEAQAAICQAVIDGDIERVKLLISKGPYLNEENEKGQIPLNLAAREGHKEIVELLLEHGADVNVGSVFGNEYNNWIAAEFAMSNNHTEIAQLLVSKGSDISPLIFAIYMEDEIKARSLIEGGADVNSRTPGGMTPLHQAVNKGLKDIVELLIAYDADVNAGHYWGWTPLHSAALYGYEDIAELLINAGANVIAKDEAGRIPLWYAEREGYTKTAELLRKHGAKE